MATTTTTSTLTTPSRTCRTWTTTTSSRACATPTPSSYSQAKARTKRPNAAANSRTYSAPKASRTRSTCGAMTLTTIGPGGARCCRTGSTGCCKQKAKVKRHKRRRQTAGFSSVVDEKPAVCLLLLCLFTFAFCLQQPVEPVRQHLAPPGPIVVNVIAPHVERVRDAFGAEYVREFAAAFGRFVRALACEYDDGVGVAQAREEVVVVQVRQVRDGVVKVDVVVVVAIEPLPNVVAAAHRDCAAQNVWVSEV